MSTNENAAPDAIERYWTEATWEIDERQLSLWITTEHVRVQYHQRVAEMGPEWTSESDCAEPLVRLSLPRECPSWVEVIKYRFIEVGRILKSLQFQRPQCDKAAASDCQSTALSDIRHDECKLKRDQRMIGHQDDENGSPAVVGGYSNLPPINHQERIERACSRALTFWPEMLWEVVQDAMSHSTLALRTNANPFQGHVYEQCWVVSPRGSHCTECVHRIPDDTPVPLRSDDSVNPQGRQRKPLRIPMPLEGPGSTRTHVLLKGTLVLKRR